MPRTYSLRPATSALYDNFDVKQYRLSNMRLFSVHNKKPEKNPENPEEDLWTSTCYVIKFDEGAVVIDPGFTNIDETEKIVTSVSGGFQKCHVLLTHGHFDHLYGAARILRGGGKVFIHKDDRTYIEGLSTDPEENKQLARRIAAVRWGAWKPKLKYDFIRDEEELRHLQDSTVLLTERTGHADIKGSRISYYNDRGHTLGHTIYFFNGLIFAGDLVVQGDGEWGWYLNSMYGKGDDEGDEENKRDLQKIKKACRESLDLVVNHTKFNYIALGHGGILSQAEIKKIAEKIMKE